MQHNHFPSRMADRCLGLRVGRLHRLVTRCFEQALAPTGLTLPQLEILAALTVRGDATRPSWLAQFLAAERSTISRNLALMEQRGWIDVVERSASGRAMTVAVSRAGLDALHSAEDAWRAAQAHIEGALGDGSPVTLDLWLARLTENDTTPSPPRRASPGR